MCRLKLVDNALIALKNQCINKIALVVFERNKNGNTFWESKVFEIREDMVYSNKSFTDIIRIDT